MAKRIWIITLCVAVALGATLFLVFAAGQPAPTKVVTLNDIYALLTTPDGGNRLEDLTDMLHDIDGEVDIIHTQAQKMIADDAAAAAGQKWTLDDIQYSIGLLDSRLSDIEARLDALEARSVTCP